MTLCAWVAPRCCARAAMSCCGSATPAFSSTPVPNISWRTCAAHGGGEGGGVNTARAASLGPRQASLSCAPRCGPWARARWQGDAQVNEQLPELVPRGVEIIKRRHGFAATGGLIAKQARASARRALTQPDLFLRRFLGVPRSSRPDPPRTHSAVLLVRLAPPPLGLKPWEAGGLTCVQGV